MIVGALVAACSAASRDVDEAPYGHDGISEGDRGGPGTGASMCTIDDTTDAGLAPIGPNGCAVGTVIVYRKTLQPGAGGSAVGSAGEATAASDAGDGGALPPMTPACAAISCGPGQVGVVTFSSAPGSPPGPPAPIAADASTTDDAASDGGASDDAAAPADADAAATMPLPACPGFVIKCIDAPPTCPDGQAPSFAPSGKWHCMPLCDPNDPNMVVISYGGQFGATRICAGAPPKQACPNAQDVWTWDFNDEEWVCRTKCDNGMYDQHDYGGQTVCVPC